MNDVNTKCTCPMLCSKVGLDGQRVVSSSACVSVGCPSVKMICRVTHSPIRLRGSSTLEFWSLILKRILRPRRRPHTPRVTHFRYRNQAGERVCRASGRASQRTTRFSPHDWETAVPCRRRVSASRG